MTSEETINVGIRFEPHGQRVVSGQRTVKLRTILTAIDVYPIPGDPLVYETSSPLSNITFDLPLYSQEFIYNTLRQNDIEANHSEIIAPKMAMAAQQQIMCGVQEFVMNVDLHITDIMIIDDEPYFDFEDIPEDDENVSENYVGGVTEEAIKKLQRINGADLNRDNAEECSICLNYFSGVCEIIKMPCSHLFHQSCIFKWLQNKNTCPLCRSTVS